MSRITKVLLLGGTGKLGKNVLKELLNHTDRYDIGLLLKSTSYYNNTHNFKLFEGDITLQQTITTAVQWADVVINCAGLVSYDKKDKKKLFAVNVYGVQNLAMACNELKKALIHTSSAVAYGSSKEPILFRENEYHNHVYRSDYSTTKFMADQFLEESDMPYIILRPSTLISNEKSTLKGLYDFYKKGLIAEFNGGASFALVEEIAKAYIFAIELAIEHPVDQSIFNLGGSNVTFQEVFNCFKKIDYIKTRTIPNWLMGILSVISDRILGPVFNKTILTGQNFHTGNHFTFIDSSKAKKLLNYKITEFRAAVETLF